jgi:hypothetical protein
MKITAAALACTIAASALAGCNSLNRTERGALIGAGVGGATGAAVTGTAGGTLIGAGAGAVGGAIIADATR